MTIKQSPSLRCVFISLLAIIASASQASGLQTAASSPSQQLPQALVRAAINAMGGEAALRGIKLLQFKANEQRNALEQSEGPEGPYIVQSGLITETRDFD